MTLLLVQNVLHIPSVWAFGTDSDARSYKKTECITNTSSDDNSVTYHEFRR